MHAKELLETMTAWCKEAYGRARVEFDAANSKGHGYTKKNPYPSSPQWDGGIDSLGREFKESVWEKMAKFMLKHGLDPELCIKLRFDAATWDPKKGSKRAPLPNMIANATHLPLYQGRGFVDKQALPTVVQVPNYHALCSRCSDIVIRWQLFHPEHEPELAYKVALLSESAAFPPLFSYAFAVSVGQKQLARRFERAAILQYLTAPDEYDAQWGASIPETIKEEARAALILTVGGKRARSED